MLRSDDLVPCVPLISLILDHGSMDVKLECSYCTWTLNATVPPSLTRLVAVSFHSRKDFKDIFSSQDD